MDVQVIKGETLLATGLGFYPSSRKTASGEQGYCGGFDSNQYLQQF
jgi:hypothetical protein